MSLGVATAGALLGGFTVEGAAGSEVLHAFQLTFLCVGAMAMLAAALFLQLSPATLVTAMTPGARLTWPNRAAACDP